MTLTKNARKLVCRKHSTEQRMTTPFVPTEKPKPYDGDFFHCAVYDNSGAVVDEGVVRASQAVRSDVTLVGDTVTYDLPPNQMCVIGHSDRHLFGEGVAQCGTYKELVGFGYVDESVSESVPRIPKPEQGTPDEDGIRVFRNVDSVECKPTESRLRVRRGDRFSNLHDKPAVEVGSLETRQKERAKVLDIPFGRFFDTLAQDNVEQPHRLYSCRIMSQREVRDDDNIIEVSGLGLTSEDGMSLRDGGLLHREDEVVVAAVRALGEGHGLQAAVGNDLGLVSDDGWEDRIRFGWLSAPNKYGGREHTDGAGECHLTADGLELECGNKDSPHFAIQASSMRAARRVSRHVGKK